MKQHKQIELQSRSSFGFGEWSKERWEEPLFDSENEEAEGGYIGWIEMIEDGCCSYEREEGEDGTQ
jgi:hypothetical protein